MYKRHELSRSKKSLVKVWRPPSKRDPKVAIKHEISLRTRVIDCRKRIKIIVFRVFISLGQLYVRLWGYSIFKFGKVEREAYIRNEINTGKDKERV
jgi:hypothetical protein